MSTSRSSATIIIALDVITSKGSPDYQIVASVEVDLADRSSNTGCLRKPKDHGMMGGV
jgi:hypothetical protein